MAIFLVRSVSRRSHYLAEGATMVNMFDEIWVEAEAKGKAGGKAEGLIALIRHRVVMGKLTIDEARAEV